MYELRPLTSEGNSGGMVGFTLLSRSYYYLRRRSPGLPFPPDHRQAGERGAIIRGARAHCALPLARCREEAD